MNKIIFVGGAAGVGKSTICKNLAERDKKTINLKFFKCISAEGPMLPKTEQLEKWEELQISLIKNQILPLANTNNDIIFDTHYSFQKGGGPDIAFAKRNFDPRVITGPTYCKEFAISLTKLSIPVVLVLLKANINEIRLRQMKDTGNALVENIIEKEQEAEERCWKFFAKILSEVKIVHHSEIVVNMGTIESAILKIINISEGISNKNRV